MSENQVLVHAIEIANAAARGGSAALPGILIRNAYDEIKELNDKIKKERE